MDMAMVTMDIMARDLLMLSQLLLLSLDMDMVMDILAMDMVAMDTMDTMARGLLMLSLDMDIMDMVMDMAMDMVMATMDTMARDLLMLSLVMDIMAMDMDTMDMVMDMAMDMDITVKQICCLFLEFSTNEVGLEGSSQTTQFFHLMEINIEKRK